LYLFYLFIYLILPVQYIQLPTDPADTPLKVQLLKPTKAW